jgi:hypothetical protein
MILHEDERKSINMMRYALAYASRGLAVFPCKPDKSPYTVHGCLDASTQASQVTAWWTRWPDASIGMACGKISGKVALDKDADTPEALAIWERLPGGPTSKTGRLSGVGRHRLYKTQKGKKVKTRNLAGSALRLQGDGAYIILPPSRHPDGGRYEWVEGSELVDLPEELITPDEERRTESGPASLGPRFTDDGGPIPEGERNNTLTRIGGRLRAQGLDREEVLEELLAVNESRCQPPLGSREVWRIAASVSRYPAGSMSHVDTKTLETLEGIQREMWQTRWTNKGDLDIVKSLIRVGRKAGSLHPRGGVEVSISYRELAIEAAVSLRTVRKGIERLVESGWVRKGRRGSGTRAGTLILLRRGKVPHSNHRGGDSAPTAPSVVPIRAPRLRHTAILPVNVKGRRVDTIVIKRLGKTCGTIIDILQTHGPSVTVGEIGAILQVRRPRDLTRKSPHYVDKDGPITRLQKRGIVTVEGDTVTLVGEWEQALDMERTLSGEKFQEAYWRKRYREQQEAYRGRHKVKARRFTMAQMWDRLARPLTELTRVPEPSEEVVRLVQDYLSKHPSPVKTRPSWYPGWLRNTLWSYDLITSDVSRLEVEVALYEFDKEGENPRGEGKRAAG